MHTLLSISHPSFSCGAVQAQEGAASYLDAFEKKYSGLRDYTADVKVHFAMETFKAPDLQAKVDHKVS